MARSITASVGRMGGMNRPADVKTIQELLNKVPEGDGGPHPKLVVTGICGNDTSDAIHRFQVKRFGYHSADGRVDPGGPTLKKLNEFDTAGQSSGGSSSPGAHQVVGEITYVFGTPIVVDYRGGVVSKEPAKPGIIIHPYMIVEGTKDADTVSIRLTTGHDIHLSGRGMLSVGPSL